MKKIILLLFISNFSILSGADLHPLSLAGNQQFSLHQYDAAMVSYNQLIQYFPDNKAGYFNRGLCLYKTENYAQAIYDFEECLILDSIYIKAAIAKAFSLEKKGELKAAIASYTLLNGKVERTYLLHKRIQNYELAVLLSKKWYYMLAMLLIAVILLALVSKSFAKRA